MISRNNSNATDRLHRAKSTSSAHTTSSSGHQRLSTSIDPFISRRDAEAAATEACSRAAQLGEQAVQSRPNLSRRQSQRRAEGSHFEEARRRALAQSGNAAHASKAPQHDSHRTSKMSTDGDGETVVTRRRSVIPPAADATRMVSSQQNLVPPVRKRTSGYTDGSPAPRYSLLERRSSTLQLRQPEESTLKNTGRCTEPFTQYSDLKHENSHSMLPLPAQGRSSFNESLTDADVVNATGPGDNSEIQPRQIRERKSFLGPFQKRKVLDNEIKFDTSLPPFNYADMSDAAPIISGVSHINPSTARSQLKTRNLSDTIKGRLKRVFRKVSRPQPPPTGIPPQQIEAKDFHFAVRDHDLSEASFVDYTDPFMTVAAEEPRAPSPQNKYTTASTTSKSRVTSWTNSTINQSSVRTANGPFTVGQDPARSLHRSDSNATLRKTSSLFFGRPMRNRLRRTSKADLKPSSEESHSLYTALQKRIRTSRSAEPAKESNAVGPGAQQFDAVSALAKLPSQAQRVPSTHFLRPHRVSSTSDADQTTIRPVSTPDLPPVAEVNNDNSSASSSPNRTVLHHPSDSTPHAPSTPLRRSCAIKAPPPSKDQLARRKEVAEKRWSSTLAPFAPGHEDNPYVLPSMNRTMAGSGVKVDVDRVDLPYAFRADVISPSVYSRATDGASPRPETPMDMDVSKEGGVGVTRITVTGREVRRFEISPGKRRGDDGGSQEWRDWIAGELSEFTSARDGVEHGDDGRTDLRLLDEDSVLRGSRPASAASGRYLNDRYPAFYNIAAGGNRSRASSRASNAPSSGTTADNDTFLASARGRKTSVEFGLNPSGTASGAGAETYANMRLAGGAAARQRRISKPRSFAEIEADVKQPLFASHAGKASLAAAPMSDAVKPVLSPSVPVDHAPKTVTSSRPKSAYDLRANWKATASARANELEVKRRENVSPVESQRHTTSRAGEIGRTLDKSTFSTTLSRNGNPSSEHRNSTPPFEVDPTLLRISAGPYAENTPVPAAERKQGHLPAYRNQSHSFTPTNQENIRPPCSSATGQNIPTGGDAAYKEANAPSHRNPFEAHDFKQSGLQDHSTDDHHRIDTARLTRVSDTIPALSSSEWLAASSLPSSTQSRPQHQTATTVPASNFRRKDVFGTTRMNRNGDDDVGGGGQSEIRSTLEVMARKEEMKRSSPGQRLVRCWLKEGGSGRREGGSSSSSSNSPFLRAERDGERKVTTRFI